jgi:hypothetical protein
LRLLRALLFAAVVLCGTLPAAAGSLRFCDNGQPLGAREQDRLLRFAAVVQQVLDDAGRKVALVSRTGLDLHRFGLLYSHAGLAVRGEADGRWSVRQLYYACDERRPRIYDQGLPGFVLGTDDARIGHVSLVLLPEGDGAPVARAARDNALALRLLGADYSANAFPFSLRYQNCNQWVVELLAAAWGALPDGDELRAHAQGWLVEQGYAPETIDVGSRWLMFAAGFVPWVHTDDQAPGDLLALRVRTSVPASIEAFVHERLPGAERIELCHDERQVVVHRGWTPLAPGCAAGEGDAVVAIDD